MKQFYKSKTIIFNMLVAVFAVLSSESQLLDNLLDDKQYLIAMSAIAAVNAYLRTISSTKIIK